MGFFLSGYCFAAHRGQPAGRERFIVMIAKTRIIWLSKDDKEFFVEDDDDDDVCSILDCHTQNASWDGTLTWESVSRPG